MPFAFVLPTIRHLIRCVSLFCLSLALIHPSNAAEFDIKGVEDKSVRQNIQLFLQAIEPPVNSTQVQEFEQQLEAKATEAMEVFGYYQTQVTISASDIDKQTWALNIQTGPQTKLQNVDIQLQGDAQDDPIFRQKLASIELKPGQPLSHQRYEKVKSELQSLALARGYFDFRYSQHQIEVDSQQQFANIRLHAQSGQRYRMGEIQLDTEDRAYLLVKQLQPYQTGDFYVSDAIANFNRRLKDTNYFRQVVVRPLVTKAENGLVPIEVILSHAPRDTFDLGGGYSSDIGPRAKVKWRHPWVNAAGHSMTSEMFVSAPEQYLTWTYKIPLEDPIKNYASFQAGWQKVDDNDTDSETLTLALQRHKELSQSEWQRITFLRYQLERFRQGQSDDPFEKVGLVIPGVTFSRLRSRGGLDVNWGDKQIITTEVASANALSDVNMLRISAQTRWLRSFGNHRILLRAEGGAIATNDFDLIPSSLRYFAGGDQSIRGFAYNSISPVEVEYTGDVSGCDATSKDIDECKDDIETTLVGAQYLAVASAEYSYPLRDDWRIAVFTDIGNATNKFDQDLARGYGIGAIWQSPIGDIRLYIARGESSLENNWRLHFSMGPSL